MQLTIHEASDIPNFQTIAIGAPSPLSFPNEGAFIQFSPSGITLFLALSNPDDYEHKALRAAHPTKIGVLNHGRTGFLLIDFGEDFVLDAPFDAGIEQPENVPDLSGVRKGGLILLSIVGVDAWTGRVFGIRGVTLSGHVSRVTAQLISRQIDEVITPALNEQAIAAAYRRYPDAQSMMRDAVMGKAGQLIAPEASNLGNSETIATGEPSPVFGSGAGSGVEAGPLRHVTLSTGDTRDCFCNEVGREVIDALGAWIDNTIQRGRKFRMTPDAATTSGGVSYGAEIPGCPGYTAVITPHGANVMVSVIYGSASVVTFAVATREEGSTSLWNQIHVWAEHEGVMPVMTCAENPPAVPWCAAKLDAGIFQPAAYDALLWIGDFERCFAWAWIERNKR